MDMTWFQNILVDFFILIALAVIAIGKLSRLMMNRATIAFSGAAQAIDLETLIVAESAKRFGITINFKAYLMVGLSTTVVTINLGTLYLIVT